MTTTLALDATVWTFIFLVLGYGLFMVLAYLFGFQHDDLIWLVGSMVPAGMIMLFLSFEAWTLSSSYFASIAIAMVAIATIAYPILMLFRKMIT